MNVGRFTQPRLFAILCGSLLLELLAISGCGSDTPRATDSQRLAGLLSSINDAARDPQSFQTLFAKGAAPAEAQRPRYLKYSYEVKSEKMSGDTATATVVVHDSQSGNVLGEVEWTAVKEGDAWRLEKAPLP
jgi:hypothetical protein